jgi:hypothetical protein
MEYFRPASSRCSVNRGRETGIGIGRPLFPAPAFFAFYLNEPANIKHLCSFSMRKLASAANKCDLLLRLLQIVLTLTVGNSVLM